MTIDDKLINACYVGHKPKVGRFKDFKQYVDDVYKELYSIVIFFCEKCPDSPLYPKNDLVRQIRIDQAVYDVILSNIHLTIISFPSWKIFGIPQTEKDLRDFEYSLSKLSKQGSKYKLFTNGADFLVEDQISIADIFLACNLSLPALLSNYDYSKFPKIEKFYTKMKTVPEFQKIDNKLAMYTRTKLRSQRLKNITMLSLIFDWD